MKLLLYSLLFMLFAANSYSQYSLPKGSNQLNFGIGLSERGIPLYIGIDHGIHKDVSLGGEMSFRSYSDRFDKKSYNHTIIGISGNVNYHFNSLMQIPRNWDFYAGLNLGFFIWSSPSEYKGSHSSGLGLGAQIGGRYFFSNKFALNLEIGGGNHFSGGKFGATLKL